MPETLPMLETDPRRRFQTTRLLRVALFSLVSAAVIVSILIVIVRFLWDNFAAKLLNQGPYDANPLLVLPAMVVIAALMAKVLWDNAEKGAPRRR
jgi:hypothetical protein